ncbi:MAG: hypothetical protein IGR93_22550 [Hydrococcus sp. C42_A2020_068]|uniref:hypothetical protein n=1 Tax=Pleurocapsa sp. PCC 7327 TaxID=118163 RepID=UPI001641FB2B|nr:hypothetical protein [Pleurocapsa sp. PCC 7327]MBF2022793.1 hypothetical protein [Hydrococcus sp. C42_A2020_068]
MIRSIVVLLLLALSLAVTLPVQATPLCRNYSDRVICILSIKRSAKYHWQYLATVSIDGIVRPMEVYNCRDRFRIQKDGTVLSFEPHGAGELICNFFKR